MKKGITKRFSAIILVLAMSLTMLFIPQASATVVETSSPIARQVANEGFVLLKNDNNALPLSGQTPEKVAIFGQGQIYDGTNTAGFQIAGNGSAAVTPVTVVDPLDAFKALETAGKIDLYNELSAAYEANMAYVPDDAMYTAVGNNADTAVVIITRNPSATGDRTEADWYLTDAEKAMLKKLTDLKTSGALNKIVVLLNIGSTIETAWAKDGNADGIDVDAVLSVWYPGEQGGNAIADTLMGDSNPSGKLSDTFAVSLDDYGFSVSDETYSEDIFVGYRYFETFGIPVSYPFGYGLSYTSFEYGAPSYSVADGEITVSVDVKNTGTVPGKDVVQVYYSAPQKGTGSAVMSKASIELAAFKKTGLIEPGATETVSITYSVNDMASYDDEDVTGKKSAYVLEAGDYKVYVGNSVKEAQTRLAGTYTVNSLTVTEQLSQYLAPKTSFNKTVVVNNGGTITKGTQAVQTGTDAAVADRSYTPYSGEASADVIAFDDVLKGNATIEQFVGQMTVDELIAFTVGHPRTSSSDGHSKAVIGAGEAINDKYGIPAADTFNGPCGIQIGTNATAFGSEVLMACTWNTDLINELGKAMGREGIASGADILLTTSLNIHRHPLNGRHFEYFSEDPVLMGEMASAQMLGVQSQGVTVTLKHFALYNKRYPQAQNANVTERAAREIYLKGFEIAVKDSVAEDNALAIMSSYGKINETYASESKGLMTGILRNEWGFDGLVMSDWGAAAEAATSFLAGNNIKVPSSSTSTNTGSNSQREGYINSVKTAYNAGTITRNQLELNAIDILNVLAALPDGLIDILPTSRIYVSSTYADNSSKPYTVNKLWDNNKETDWASLAETGQARLVVDFGKPIKVSLVEFYGARMSNMRKDFNVYLSNDGEFVEKDLLYNYVSGAQGANYKLNPSTTDTITQDKYRYLMFEAAVAGTKFGMSELRVYANATQVGMGDNSVVNVSDLTQEASYISSATYAGWAKSRATDMNANSEFITSQGTYYQSRYMFIDLGAPKKLDSISLIIGTSSGRGKPDGVYIDPVTLRTDFDIVARNDSNVANTTNETVLINYTGTLGPDTGDSSGFCVLEVPDEYKNTEFRYIGIRKDPTTANNNVGQICVHEMGVYVKAADYPHNYSKPTASYDRDAGTVTISTVARTTENEPYKFIVAGYSENGTLLEVQRVDLKAPSESTRAEKETEVQGVGYATKISKTITLENHLDVAYANVILLKGFDTLLPLSKNAEIELNPAYLTQVQLLKDPVFNYMRADLETIDVISYSGSANPKTYYDDQKPVIIDWDAVDGATSYTVTLSEYPDYSNGKTYTTETNSVEVTNLYVARKYYWKAVSDNGTEKTGTFETQGFAPRYITTETASNLRDLGGWMTESGIRVKQGKMFRGAEISDDDSKNSYIRGGLSIISDNDMDLFRNELGIKTEIDLRGSENADRTTSTLGNDVAYVYKPISFNSTVDAYQAGLLKDILTVMADESNYPIYFHCVGGNDRTARLAYIINGLLGVSKEELIRDWELSSFSFNTVRHRNDSYWTGFGGFIDYIDTFEGATVSAKIENFLLTQVKLTQDQINSIKNIMLDK